MNCPKGLNKVFRKEWVFPDPHVVPVTIHPRITGNQSYVIVGDQTYVTQCEICEQSVHDDHSIS